MQPKLIGRQIRHRAFMEAGEKSCTQCKQVKPLGDFSPKDNTFQAACKACCSTQYRERYATRSDIREASRKRRRKAVLTGYAKVNEQRYAREGRRKKQVVTKEQRARYRANTLAKNPERHKARIAVCNAVRSGKIVRQRCLICKSAKSEAHHPDYSLPLDVMWLCRLHHRAYERLFVGFIETKQGEP